jgi:hypothetical protein
MVRVNILVSPKKTYAATENNLSATMSKVIASIDQRPSYGPIRADS